MAIAFRQGTRFVQNGSFASPHTATEPTGATSGDVLIAIAICSPTTVTLTRPTGWTNLYSGAASTNYKYDVSYVVRGGSAPSYAWTSSANTSYLEVKILCYSGVDNTTPVNANNQQTVATATSPNPAAVTTTVSPTQVVILGANWNGSTGQPTAPTGYTNRLTWTSGDDAVVADKALATATTEDPAAWGTFGGSSSCWSATVALADASASGGATTVKNLAALGVG